MTREQLEHAIRAAGAISGDRELYVVGSQAILGAHPQGHPDLCRSMEVDVAPKNYPEREALIEGSIGELSPFHQTFGFYVDGVEIHLIALPRGWEERLVPIDNANTNGVRGLCLDPADLAVSKLVAHRDKDLDFVQVLLREKIVSSTILEQRLNELPVLPTDRRAAIVETIERLASRATGSASPSHSH